MKNFKTFIFCIAALFQINALANTPNPTVCPTAEAVKSLGLGAETFNADNGTYQFSNENLFGTTTNWKFTIAPLEKNPNVSLEKAKAILDTLSIDNLAPECFAGWDGTICTCTYKFKEGVAKFFASAKAVAQ